MTLGIGSYGLVLVVLAIGGLLTILGALLLEGNKFQWYPVIALLGAVVALFGFYHLLLFNSIGTTFEKHRVEVVVKDGHPQYSEDNSGKYTYYTIVLAEGNEPIYSSNVMVHHNQSGSNYVTYTERTLDTSILGIKANGHSTWSGYDLYLTE